MLCASLGRLGIRDEQDALERPRDIVFCDGCGSRGLRLGPIRHARELNLIWECQTRVPGQIRIDEYELRTQNGLCGRSRHRDLLLQPSAAVSIAGASSACKERRVARRKLAPSGD
jgi:hypothetical protein